MFFRGTFLNIYNTFKRVISPCWICMFVCKFVVWEVIVRKGLTGNMAIGPVGRNLCHATLLSDVWEKNCKMKNWLEFMKW